eukprot:3267095-Pyramimonas_sp.AAC.1
MEVAWRRRYWGPSWPELAAETLSESRWLKVGLMMPSQSRAVTCEELVRAGRTVGDKTVLVAFSKKDCVPGYEAP